MFGRGGLVLILFGQIDLGRYFKQKVGVQNDFGKDLFFDVGNYLLPEVVVGLVQPFTLLFPGARAVTH